MMWFGESWGAPVCQPERHVSTPVGAVCIECDKPIRMGDTGFNMALSGREPATTLAYHRVCFLRTIIPCEMWNTEMKTNLPQRWREHLEEHHHESMEDA